jgi:hypothetical protein
VRHGLVISHSFAFATKIKKSFIRRTGQRTLLAITLGGAKSAAANRGVVEAQAAAATGGGATAQAITASLNDIATGGVTTAAGDANAVFRVFALADGHRQVALTKTHPVEHATAAAQSVTAHTTQVLQRGASELVIANTVDFHSAGALFKGHLAAGNHHGIGRSGASRGGCGSTHRSSKSRLSADSSIHHH